MLIELGDLLGLFVPRTVVERCETFRYVAVIARREFPEETSGLRAVT